MVLFASEKAEKHHFVAFLILSLIEYTFIRVLRVLFIVIFFGVSLMIIKPKTL